MGIISGALAITEAQVLLAVMYQRTVGVADKVTPAHQAVVVGVVQEVLVAAQIQAVPGGFPVRLIGAELP